MHWKSLGLVALLLASPVSSPALTINFDTSLDTNGFFTTNPTALTDLNAAAAAYTRLTDNLTAITPGGSNTWTASFANPSSSATTTLSNLTIAANSITIFVGARSDMGTSLGFGGFGGSSSNGTTAFNNIVAARGQAGALTATKTDFGPWGGSIAFNLNSSWYFDSDPSTLESFVNKNDFYSVAVHEIGHVLGFGGAPSFTRLISTVGSISTFTGAAATAANGGIAPLLDGSSDTQHWLEGLQSTLPGTNTIQEAAMDPTLSLSTRKYFTTLDYAALSDIGWTVAAVPEPSTWVLLGCGAAFLVVRKRKMLAS